MHFWHLANTAMSANSVKLLNEAQNTRCIRWNLSLETQPRDKLLENEDMNLSLTM